MYQSGAQLVQSETEYGFVVASLGQSFKTCLVQDK